MRIVILGAGYVGTAYARTAVFLGFTPVVMSRAWINYASPTDLTQQLRNYKPDVVINAAGFMGQTIDDCERHRTKTFDTHVLLVKTVVEACQTVGCQLIHISTGCMFSGTSRHYIETDPPDNGVWDPGEKVLNNAPFYITCKLAGEQEALKYARSYLFRIRMPFNQQNHPRNLLVKLCRYPRILEGWNSLTFLDEFCMRSLMLIQKSHAYPGIYHAAYPTGVSTVEVARLLFDAGLRTLPVEIYPPDHFIDHGYVRRSQAILDSSKFESVYGAAFGDPMCAIRWCIDRMKEERASSQ